MVSILHGGRDIVIYCKIQRKKLADDKESDILNAVGFGHRNFKPSNAILLALMHWCPIIAVKFAENYVLFMILSRGLITFFLQFSRIILIHLYCS